MPMHRIGLLLGSGMLSALALAQYAGGPQQAGPLQPPSTKASQQTEKTAKKPADGHLTRVETITATSEMATVFYPPLRCDGDGNLYLRTDSGGVPAIHKLNAKGERVALFEASSNPDLKVDVARYFALEADGGELYELVYPHEINRYVFVYKSDGTFKSALKLRPGFPFMPKKLAVFSSGQFLISGEEYDADRTAAMWPFTGIFAADGSLVKELELGDEKDLRDMASSGDTRVARPGNPHANLAIDNGQAETAADGNAYLMRWTNPAIFYGISPGGEVVHRFTVDPGESASDYRPAAMHVYKNRIAVLFVKMHVNEEIMKIVDLEGHEIATYDGPKPDDKAPNSMLSAAFACYTENPTRFVFLGADDKDKVQLWVAEPR